MKASAAVTMCGPHLYVWEGVHLHMDGRHTDASGELLWSTGLGAGLARNNTGTSGRFKEAFGS